MAATPTRAGHVSRAPFVSLVVELGHHQAPAMPCRMVESRLTDKLNKASFVLRIFDNRLGYAVLSLGQKSMFNGAHLNAGVWLH